MSEFIKEWFGWFEKAISCMDLKEKEKFFCTCGRNCADSGIIKMYEEQFIENGQDLDAFFISFRDNQYVGGIVIEAGRIYEITFPDCYCDLYTLGYVNSDYICECSRQSIIYVMNTLKPDTKFHVEKLSTVIGGDKECRFRITVI